MKGLKKYQKRCMALAIRKDDPFYDCMKYFKKSVGDGANFENIDQFLADFLKRITSWKARKSTDNESANEPEKMFTPSFVLKLTTNENQLDKNSYRKAMHDRTMAIKWPYKFVDK